MHLDLSSSSAQLDLTLEEAFELQAALADLIKRHAMNTAVGLQKSRFGTGQDHLAGATLTDFSFVRTQAGPVLPGSLTVLVTRPYTKV